MSLIEARFAVCQNHPEKQEIFKLEKLLLEAGHPYYFNFWDALRPTPFEPDGGDPETDIDWDNFNFLIEVGPPVAPCLSEISVCFNTKGDPKLLELLDMRAAGKKENATADDGTLICGLLAEQAKEIIEKYFKGE